MCVCEYIFLITIYLFGLVIYLFIFLREKQYTATLSTLTHSEGEGCLVQVLNYPSLLMFGRNYHSINRVVL